MIARLTLQHEFERIATARAENVALESEANSEILLAMEASKEASGEEGESLEDQRRSTIQASQVKSKRQVTTMMDSTMAQEEEWRQCLAMIGWKRSYVDPEQDARIGTD